MASITKEKKKEIVDELASLWTKSGGVLFTHYIGINGKRVTELRQRIKEAGGLMKVAKHTLIRRCAEKLGHQGMDLDSLLQSTPTALLFMPEDFPNFMRGFLRLQRDYGELQIKGAIVERRVFKREECRMLADLLPREVVLAQMAGAVMGPIYSLVYTLQATITRLVWALEAIKKAKGGEQI